MKINFKYTVVFLLLTQTISPAYIDFFFEHNPLDGQNDFLYLFNDINAQSVSIFKLDFKLAHREAFNIQICKIGTIAKLQKNPELDLTQECLLNEFNTIVMTDYSSKIFQFNLPFYNIYEICTFGMAIQEGEHSFMTLNHEKVQAKENIEGKYYSEMESILQLYEDPNQSKYREDYFKKSEYRCHTSYGMNKPFEYTKFQSAVEFQSNKGKNSNLILEYDFNDQDKIPVFIKQKLSKEVDMKRIQKIQSKFINQLKEHAEVSNSELHSGELLIQIQDTEGKNLSISFGMNMKELFTLKMPIKPNKGKYLRFLPMFCYVDLDPKETIDRNIFQHHSCVPLSSEKILLANSPKKQDIQEGYYFVEKTSYKKLLKLPVTIENLTYFFKDFPGNEVVSQGLKNNCDLIMDYEYFLMMFTCFQNVKVQTSNGLMTMYYEKLRDKKPEAFEILKIETNSEGKIRDKLRTLSLGFRLFLLIVGVCLIAAAIIMIAVTGEFVLATGLLLGFGVFLILLVIVLRLCDRNNNNVRRNRNNGRRILAGDLIKNYSNPKKVAQGQKKIREMSMVTPSLFKNGATNVVIEIKNIKFAKPLDHNDEMIEFETEKSIEKDFTFKKDSALDGEKIGQLYSEDSRNDVSFNKDQGTLKVITKKQQAKQELV